MNYAQKRAKLISSHEAALAKLDIELGIAQAFVSAGLGEPDFICVHDSHASVSFYPDHVSYKKWSPADALKMLESLKPFIVRMEPALKDGFSRSLYPVAARGKGVYSDGGIEYDIELSQSLFGESADSQRHGPSHRKDELSVWANVGGKLVEVSLEIEGFALAKHRVYYSAAHGGSFVKPSIPFSRVFSFGGGGHYSADVRYLFPSIDCCAEALLGKVAA